MKPDCSSDHELTGLLIKETCMNLVLSLKYRSHDTLPSLTKYSHYLCVIVLL